MLRSRVSIADPRPPILPLCGQLFGHCYLDRPSFLIPRLTGVETGAVVEATAAVAMVAAATVAAAMAAAAMARAVTAAEMRQRPHQLRRLRRTPPPLPLRMPLPSPLRPP